MALIIKDRTIMHQVLEIVISMLYKLVIYTAFVEKNKYLILNNLKSAKPNILCIKHNIYNDLSILNFYTNPFQDNLESLIYFFDTALQSSFK